MKSVCQSIRSTSKTNERTLTSKNKHKNTNIKKNKKKEKISSREDSWTEELSLLYPKSKSLKSEEEYIEIDSKSEIDQKKEEEEEMLPNETSFNHKKRELRDIAGDLWPRNYNNQSLTQQVLTLEQIWANAQINPTFTNEGNYNGSCEILKDLFDEILIFSTYSIGNVGGGLGLILGTAIGGAAGSAVGQSGGYVAGSSIGATITTSEKAVVENILSNAERGAVPNSRRNRRKTQRARRKTIEKYMKNQDEIFSRRQNYSFPKSDNVNKRHKLQNLSPSEVIGQTSAGGAGIGFGTGIGVGTGSGWAAGKRYGKQIGTEYTKWLLFNSQFFAAKNKVLVVSYVYKIGTALIENNVENKLKRKLILSGWNVIINKNVQAVIDKFQNTELNPDAVFDSNLIEMFENVGALAGLIDGMAIGATTSTGIGGVFGSAVDSRGY